MFRTLNKRSVRVNGWVEAAASRAGLRCPGCPVVRLCRWREPSCRRRSDDEPERGRGTTHPRPRLREALRPKQACQPCGVAGRCTSTNGHAARRLAGTFPCPLFVCVVGLAATTVVFPETGEVGDGEVTTIAVPTEASTKNAVMPLAIASCQRVSVNMDHFFPAAGLA